MEHSLELLKVKDVEIKKINNGQRNYIRVSFDGIFNPGFKKDKMNKFEVIKCSMSKEQWSDLKNYMKISIENDNLKTKKAISVKFDPLGKTKSKNPKLLIEPKKGVFKGHDYNYYELSVGVLIENGIVQKGIIKKDYSKLFDDVNKLKDNEEALIVWN